MMTFLKLFKYLFKNTVKDFVFSFWVLCYPVILTTFFYLSLSGVIHQELTPVRVAITKDHPFHFVFEQDGENFKIIDVTSAEEGKQLTLEEKADGFVENNLDIVVAKESGVPQSVLKNVVTQIKQVQSLGKSASTIDFKKSWIKETKSDVSEGTMMFYSSLASFAMYSIFSGVVCVAYMNGNLSEVGRRVMGSSFSKWKFLIYSFATGLTLNVLSNALLLVYMTQILKLQLFTDWTGSILLMLIGNIFGLSFGILIGTL